MDFYKYICSGEQFRDRANRIPKWAREEHLEMNVPQKELWNYSEDAPKSSDPRITGIYLSVSISVSISGIGLTFRSLAFAVSVTCI